MLFNSFAFIFVFLPVALLVFFLIGNRGHFRIAISWLVLASLFFYGYWNPAYLGLIIASILVNYSLGVWLSDSSIVEAGRKLIMMLGVSLNLALLGYYKYFNFFVDTANEVFGSGLQVEAIILPLAISFFTFQQIAYLVDAWKGEAREYNFLHYCLFVTFFPQLIAGPIVHHKEMLPQFMRDSTYRVRYINLAVGLSIFLVGLFKKVIVADNFALLATPVFDSAENGEVLHFFVSAKGTVAYTFQLYFDFSGYSDMAIGLARMFGIRLPLNFNSPYRAVNIIDFWRRWHMTLSRFLRDYIYIPLGGNRKGKLRRYFNLLATMLLGGLWHGAGWTFVFWGVLHGLYLVANHAWHRIWKKPIGRWWSVSIARLTTLCFVMFAWIFFRAETFSGAKNILTGLMNLPHTLDDKLGPVADILVLMGFEFTGPAFSHDDVSVIYMFLVMLAVVWFLPNTQQLFARYRPAYGFSAAKEGCEIQKNFNWLYWRPVFIWSVFIAALGSMALLNLSSVSEFLYFQF
ncbi:MAG: MBOAT family protein [Chromatiales bacterium]|jgi:D-alanyl-lipoteichoic acid acyltransferase DltB (MBOAT superfamily)